MSLYLSFSEANKQKPGPTHALIMINAKVLSAATGSIKKLHVRYIQQRHVTRLGTHYLRQRFHLISHDHKILDRFRINLSLEASKFMCLLGCFSDGLLKGLKHPVIHGLFPAH